MEGREGKDQESGGEIIVGRKKSRNISWREAAIALEVGKHGYYFG